LAVILFQSVEKQLFWIYRGKVATVYRWGG